MKAAIEKLREAYCRYSEYRLRHGKTVDGLSSWIRREYRFVKFFYRALFENVNEWRLSVFLPSQLFRP